MPKGDRYVSAPEHSAGEQGETPGRTCLPGDHTVSCGLADNRILTTSLSQVVDPRQEIGILEKLNDLSC